MKKLEKFYLIRNNDENIVNALYDNRDILSTTVTANWWHEVFENSQMFEEYKNDPTKFLEEKEIGIFNLVGYYSETFPYDTLPKKIIKMIDKYIEYVKEKIKNAEQVYIIWGKKIWIDQLDVIKEDDPKLFLNPRMRDHKIKKDWSKK